MEVSIQGGDDGILLCCLLWAKDDLADAMSAYEDSVLALVLDHGGVVLQRARSAGADGAPHEVQFLRFGSQHSIDAYVADPRRVALAGERERVVARTELFPVELL